MPSKPQIITQLYNHRLEHITQSPAEWIAFLRAAARNYKLPFDEQLLVYAQRPDATAVLDIHRWNRQFGRYVNAGSTGIAVFDRGGARARLKYYFDIADTHETLLASPVPLWEVRPEQEQEIIEALDNSFGEPGASDSWRRRCCPRQTISPRITCRIITSSLRTWAWRSTRRHIFSRCATAWHICWPPAAE